MQNSYDLSSGFYGVSEVARLIGQSHQAVRGWVNGYSNSSSGPMLDRDFPDTNSISFLDLIELRFISYFRKYGVGMSTIRVAAQNARSEWRVSHPLALSKVRYFTDRKSIFAQAADQVHDQITWNLVSHQQELWETIEQSVENGIIFDQATSLASAWVPLPERFPDVVLNPNIAFGKPVVDGTGIPTSVLFHRWQVERSIERVAYWFEVDAQKVKVAVDFENSEILLH